MRVLQRQVLDAGGGPGQSASTLASANWLLLADPGCDPSPEAVAAAQAEPTAPDAGLVAPLAPGAQWDYWALARQNLLGRWALVRREALEQVEHPAGEGLWALALRLTRSGWAVRTLPADGAARLLDDAERARVLQAACHLAVVTPFCGRDWALARTLASYRGLDWDHRRLHLLAIDNSANPAFGHRLRHELAAACGEWASVMVVNDTARTVAGASNQAAADEAPVRQQAGAAVGRTMSRLYAQQAAMLLGRKIDLVLTLEDDVEIVTPQPLGRLVAAMGPETMAVAAVVRFRADRQASRVIAFRVVSEEPYRQAPVRDEPERVEAEPVAASHFACTLHRAEAWWRLMAQRASVNDDGRCCWHDVAHGANVRRAGYQWKLHWGVRTRHWGADGECAG